MYAWMRLGLIGFVLLGITTSVLAQATPQKEPEKVPPPTKIEYPPPPDAKAVAATVNGQHIPELAVYRGLLREHPNHWAEARQEIVNYLIDNLLVDQYLTQLKIQVDAKELEERFAQIQQEAKNEKQDFGEMLKRLHLSEAELKTELYGALRWDKFVAQQGTDKVLRDYFAKNLAMFDGRQMQARHILVSAKDDAEGKSLITALKKGVEDEVAKELSKLPAGSDKLTVEQARTKALVTAFAATAAKQSKCPSSKQGGDVGWFPRVGAMVEPFSRAAFALKPYAMSDPVKTEFGYHLILAIDQKPGREVKFDDVKEFVLDVYSERLREAIVASYKPRSKITIHPAAKK